MVFLFLISVFVICLGQIMDVSAIEMKYYYYYYYYCVIIPLPPQYCKTRWLTDLILMLTPGHCHFFCLCLCQFFCLHYRVLAPMLERLPHYHVQLCLYLSMSRCEPDLRLVLTSGRGSKYLFSCSFCQDVFVFLLCELPRQFPQRVPYVFPLRGP